MCHVFASQDPTNYATETRSVRLHGAVTSVRLEAKFWRVVDEIAASQAMSTPLFLNTLYGEVIELRGEVTNFASLLRCCCLNYLAPEFDKRGLGQNVKPARRNLAA
jgi:predicted DNA-binding ribbon-helix-helix protein